MKKFLYLILLGLVIGSTSCKTEFEKIRTQGTPEAQLSKANEYLGESDCYKAKTLYENIIGAYRGKPEQELIYFKYAKSHYCMEDYFRAASYFRDFTITYPNSKNREEAAFLVAYSYYNMSPSFRLSQDNTQKAIDEFQLFINSYPNSERVTESNDIIDKCRKKLETKAYDQAKLYYDLKQYQSATVSFENLLQEFPETPNAENIRFLMSKAAFNWAAKSIIEKEEERYVTAAKYANKFLKKYKDSTYTREVKTILEDSNLKLKEIRNE
ncbi:MAG: outer membrane protein assembly factor BamD [Saprospiraceae bacterium]